MLLDPTFLISPSWVKRGDEPEIPTDKPIDYAISHSSPGDTIQLLPGRFRRAGPFGGRRGVSLCGWDAPFRSTICRDETVGSTDAMILGPGDGKMKFVNIEFEADDRAALKTTSGVGPGIILVNCSLHGYGNAFEGGWADNSKWGVHAYDTSDWQEHGNATFAVRGEHARYFHNIQGNHNFQAGTVAHCGRTAFQFVARQNEGRVGKGNVSITSHYIEDVCLEQGGGGSAITFRGGVPGGSLLLSSNVIRLGCRRALASEFQPNIAGALLCDSSPESKPGAGDAAYPGRLALLSMWHEDYEIGTVYPGNGSAIRPAVKINNVDRFDMGGCSIRVTRPAGAYAEALVIGDDVGEVHMNADDRPNIIEGTITYKGTKYPGLDEFKAAHPEVFG